MYLLSKVPKILSRGSSGLTSCLKSCHSVSIINYNFFEISSDYANENMITQTKMAGQK